MRKLLTRTLTICTLLLLAYFVIISDETGKIPTEQAEDKLTSNALSTGEGVSVATFNLKGEKTSVGTFASVSQNLVDDELLLEKPDVTYTTASGRVIQIKADFLDTKENEQQVLSSQQGNLILVREQGGITIRTPGPLIYDPKTETLFTEAHAEFTFANFKGQCEGLKYRRDIFLRLNSKVFFESQGQGTSRVHMDAAFLELNMVERQGKMTDGVITSEMGDRRMVFNADQSRFDFVGDGNKQPYTLTDISLQGSPALFQWGEGEMEATSFDGCFDVSGQWLEYFVTSPDAVFSILSEDGYWFSGHGGQLTITALAWQPQALRSKDPVRITGKKGEGSDLFLNGSEGLETLFGNGIASSTRIFGTPHFRYGDQEGIAGSLRVLHHEHQILFSQGAELRDAGQDVFIKGDEVLLADWDKPQREIFAFKFVEITRFEGTPGATTCFGNQLELHLPGGSLKLGGSPAKVVREGETIEGNTIEITQLDGELFDLVAEEGVTLNMITSDGTFWAEARKMNYLGRKRLLTFENVSKVVVPDRGELSGGLLEAWLDRDGDGLRLNRVRMTKDVVFKGSRLVEGVRRPISCQSDEMTYKVSEEVIYFHGINRDVVFSDAKVDTRNRDLRYDLKEERLSGLGGRNRPSTTTVPLNKPIRKN